MCRHKGGDKGNSRARGEKEGAVKRRGKGRCVSGQGQEKPPSATLRVGGCRQKGVLFTSLNYAFRLYTPIIIGAVHNGCVRGRVVSMHRLSFCSSFCFRWFSNVFAFFFSVLRLSSLLCHLLFPGRCILLPVRSSFSFRPIQGSFCPSPTLPFFSCFFLLASPCFEVNIGARLIIFATATVSAAAAWLVFVLELAHVFRPFTRVRNRLSLLFFLFASKLCVTGSPSLFSTYKI